MTMRGWHLLLIGAIFVLAPRQALAQRCFEPLTNPADRDPTHFHDIAEHNPSNPAKGVIRFETLGSTKGKANIDYLFVTFTPPSGVTLPDFFRTIRLNYYRFASGDLHIYGFGPYEESTDPADPVRAANQAKWRSDQPLGALMTFNLDSAWPFSGEIGAGVPGKGASILEKRGDVQVTCASPTDFIFSTVESKVAGMHPVAGNRGFGLKANPDGTWTFYSKAVDQDSGSKMNWLLAANPMEENIFCKGQGFWAGFFLELRSFLKDKGLKIKEWNLKNHGPVPYPFGTGQQPVGKCFSDGMSIPDDPSGAILP
jgi:hypothetical protein